MARRRLRGVLIGSAVATALALSAGSARAQVVSRGAVQANGFYAAPGFYGMSFGVPSYGTVRTYSEFSSPYGAGYGYGYAPYGLLPGPYGVGLWRPGMTAPGYVYGAAPFSYRTFPVPYVPGAAAVTPPVGAYAPAFGPPSFYSR